MSEYALIIFVRNYEEKHLNKNLVQAVGVERAVEVYRGIGLDIKEIAESLRLNRFVYYSGSVPAQDETWDNVLYDRNTRSGESFAEAAADAFRDVFKQGFEKVVLVSDDAAELTPSSVDQAFEALDEVDVVVGPVKNGSVYALGLDQHDPELFESLAAKEGPLFEALIDTMIERRMIWHELPILSSPETPEDLDLLRIRKLQREVLSH